MFVTQQAINNPCGVCENVFYYIFIIILLCLTCLKILCSFRKKEVLNAGFVRCAVFNRRAWQCTASALVIFLKTAPHCDPCTTEIKVNALFWMRSMLRGECPLVCQQQMVQLIPASLLPSHWIVVCVHVIAAADWLLSAGAVLHLLGNGRPVGSTLALWKTGMNKWVKGNPENIV